MARPIAQALEVGKTGVHISAGIVYDEFLRVLQGRSGIKTYREMSDNDDIVGACLYAITQILREARWDVRVPQGGSAEDGKLLYSSMYNMKHSWSDFFSDILTMFTYGWSWFEQVYRRDGNGKILWYKLAPRAQTSWDRWEMDDVGDLLGFWQRPAPSYQLCYLPVGKSLHFKTTSAGGNPEGRSILRNAYRPWYLKKVIEEIEAIGVERDLTGLPKVKLPENINPTDDDPEVQATIAAAKRVLTNIRRDEQDGILEPHGWDFTLMSSPGQRQFDTTTIINRYNKGIAVTVLAQFVMLGMERTGSYALAEQQTDMFYMCLEGWMDSIATTINRQAVPLLMSLNGRPTDERMPHIVHTPVRRFRMKDLTNFVSELADEKVRALEVDDDLRKFLKRAARLSEFSEKRE